METTVPLLLYCIQADVSGLPAGLPPGVGGQPLQWVPAHGLAAVAGPVGEAPRDTGAVLAYGRVVEALHHRTTVIPMRYGNFLADARAVREHLVDHGPLYRQRLAVLDDCVEMGLRIPLQPAPTHPRAGADAGGRDYLLARKRALAAAERGEREAERLERAFLGLYRQRHTENGAFAGHAMYSVHYLVPRAKLDSFRIACERLPAASRKRILLSGPWPPYNFALPHGPLADRLTESAR